jgi:aspartate ammonia-lyase
MATPAFRVETDTLGSREIPIDALYGAQTDRALENFRISGRTLAEWPVFIRAFASVKEACAFANFSLGKLSERKYRAIAAACEEIRSGVYDRAFAVDVFQGGAGTSTNMNVNEVVANVALKHLGQKPGAYDVLHPIDDVNMSQSTNDVYPTAARLAAINASLMLTEELKRLVEAFQDKGFEFHSVGKLGRTQLQDAVPMTLGQEFMAFAATLDEDVKKLPEISRNFTEVSLGGTAIGTEINAPEGYGERAVHRLSELTGIDFVRSQNLVEATWDMGAFVLYSGMLKRTASKLSKIANDLRLLSSGPKAGLAEIQLPPRQPGSSIMPSKVNPVIPEVVNQVCFQVIGNDITITFAAEAGQLQLNAMMPIIVLKTFESVGYMTTTLKAFTDFCVTGIQADVETCARPLTSSVAQATSLVPKIGYEAAAKVAKLVAQGATLEAALKQVQALQEPDLISALRWLETRT